MPFSCNLLFQAPTWARLYPGKAPGSFFTRCRDGTLAARPSRSAAARMMFVGSFCLRQKAVRWAKDHISSLADWEPQIPVINNVDALPLAMTHNFNHCCIADPVRLPDSQCQTLHHAFGIVRDRIPDMLQMFEQQGN